MFNNRVQIGQDLLNVPMGEMIKDMAFAIAEAQMKLDANSMDVAEMMGGLVAEESSDGTVFRDSRVYFGQEKITKDQAVSLYNSTTDLALKTDLDTKMGADWQDDANGDKELKTGIDGNVSITIPQKLSMMELGFTPTFYQFVDNIIEVKINIKFTAEQSFNRSAGSTVNSKTKNRSGWFFTRKRRRNKTVVTNQTNASFSQKFSYSAEGSSLIRSKIVPIPPPGILEERIRRLMDIAKETT